jgi:hypothetical protein
MGATCSTTWFGDSLVITMGNTKDDDTDLWGVEYKIGKNLEHNVNFGLHVRHDDNGVENIHLGLSDHADDIIGFSVDITRVDRDGLSGETKGAGYSTFISDKQDFSIETTIIPYGCFYRDGLFVLQLKKMKYSNVAYMAAMAHYYVTKNIGLYVEVKINHSKDKGFVVELNGPFKYPSFYLQKVIVETCRSGTWSPGGKPSNETEDFNSSLNSDNIVVGQIVKRASNKGFINSNGYTNGSLNNSIFCTIM